VASLHASKDNRKRNENGNSNFKKNVGENMNGIWERSFEPCPECKSKVVELRNEIHGGLSYYYFICWNCSTYFTKYLTRSEAIKHWNDRRPWFVKIIDKWREKRGNRSRTFNPSKTKTQKERYQEIENPKGPEITE
jgi:hypothetical protein